MRTKSQNKLPKIEFCKRRMATESGSSEELFTSWHTAIFMRYTLERFMCRRRRGMWANRGHCPGGCRASTRGIVRGERAVESGPSFCDLKVVDDLRYLRILDMMLVSTLLSLADMMQTLKHEQSLSCLSFSIIFMCFLPSTVFEEPSPQGRKCEESKRLTLRGVVGRGGRAYWDEGFLEPSPDTIKHSSYCSLLIILVERPLPPSAA